MLKTISFQYYMLVQTRFILFKSNILKLDPLTVANIYAIRLNKKLNNKYRVN